jgi:tetraacyldisaccharide-1-P 4'-kinase
VAPPIACARAIERLGARAAIVGHAYGASPGRARLVRQDDALGRVGDEALMCARAGLRVAVAERRQDALDLALREADVAILDGVHQTSPRASLALLAVDPEAPWGAGACPPRGDLRAPRPALEALADLVVPVRARSRGAWSPRGVLVPWADLRRARVGLVTALARPARVVRLLESHQVVPHTTRTFPDHARVRLPKSEVDLWLATPKCAVSVAGEAEAKVHVIDHEPILDPSVEASLKVLLRQMLDPARSGSYPRKHQVKQLPDMVLAPERSA